jgi:hypothetical protein
MYRLTWIEIFNLNHFGGSSPLAGNSVDWAYDVAKIIFSYGIELRGNSFSDYGNYDI